jgi:hypothetical protein
LRSAEALDTTCIHILINGKYEKAADEGKLRLRLRSVLWRQDLQAGKTLEVLAVEGADSFHPVRHDRGDKLQIEDGSGAHGAPAQEIQPA